MIPQNYTYMTAKFSSVLAAAIALSLGAGFVAPTHAAPLAAGAKQQKVEQVQSILNITDTQKSQIKQIWDDAQNEIVNTVLTDSQRTQWQAAIASGKKRNQAMASLNLDATQKASIRKIRQAAEKKIYNEVLNTEQKQKLRQIQQERRTIRQQNK